MLINWQRCKRFGIFALIGVLFSFFISCTNPASNSPNSGTIEFWTMQLKPKYDDYFTTLIKEFETANPNTKVKWVDVPWSGMESKILAAFSAQSTPDVVNLNPDFASQLANKGAWLDLDQKVNESDRTQYLSNIWQANTLNNKSFGIPWYLTTNITIYNNDLFKKAGISKPPNNYQELAAVAKQIKEKTGKYAFFATFVPKDANDVLESLVQMNVELVNKEGKAGFNTPEGRAAFQYWVDLYKQGLLPKEVLTQGQQQGIQLYQAGETAILAAGAPLLNDIAKNAPQIAKVSAVSPQIIGSNNQKSVAVMNLVIPRNTKQPEAAVKFALFVTNRQNQLAFAQSANVLPSHKLAIADYETKLKGNQDQSNTIKGQVISAQQLPNTAVLIPPMKELPKLKEAIYSNLQAAMLGEKTVEQALIDAEKTMNS